MTSPARSCCVCKKDLTDAASIEAGIGPICRSRSNDALAHSFPARFREALAMMRTAREKGLLVCAVPEAQATLNAIGDAVLMDVDAHARSDWRVVIKQAAWVLSHNGIGGRLRCLLHDLAELLGYPATAALWRGEVVVGKATVEWAGRALVLRGPRPPVEVRDRLREGGWRYDGRSKAWARWVACAADLDAAVQLVASHFLGVEGLERAEGAARAALSTTAPTTQAPRASAEVRVEGEALVVVTPYSAAFVAALKSRLPAQARRWDGERRAWVVGAAQRAEVEALVAEHFG